MAKSDPDELRAALAAELERLQRNVDASARVQFVRSRRWDGGGILLNVVTALLAGLAGVGALTDLAGAVPAGVLALAAAALAGVAGAIGAEKKGTASAAAGNAYIEVRDAIRQARLFDTQRLAVDDLRAEVGRLTTRVHAINKSAPVAGWVARRSVRRAILREGGAGDGAGEGQA